MNWLRKAQQELNNLVWVWDEIGREWSNQQIQNLGSDMYSISLAVDLNVLDNPLDIQEMLLRKMSPEDILTEDNDRVWNLGVWGIPVNEQYIDSARIIYVPSIDRGHDSFIVLGVDSADQAEQVVLQSEWANKYLL